MSSRRGLYVAVSILTPIAYLTLALDRKLSQSIILWSSLGLTIWGIFLTATYDGPRRSEIYHFLIGKPPILTRLCAFCYGITAAIIIAQITGLADYWR